MPHKPVAAVGGKPQAVGLGNLSPGGPSFQVFPGSGTLRLMLQDRPVKTGGQLVDALESLPFVLGLFLGLAQLAFFYLDPGLARHQLDRFRKTEPLDLHDEREGVAAGAATETVKDLPGRIDVEGGGLLGVERTEAGVVRTGTSQLDIL